mgnify:CR=1 FL=1
MPHHAPAEHREKEHIERDVERGVEKPLHGVERGMALGADELRAKGVDTGGDDERGEKQSKLLTSRKHTQRRHCQQQRRRRSGAFFCRGRRSTAACIRRPRWRSARRCSTPPRWRRCGSTARTSHSGCTLWSLPLHTLRRSRSARPSRRGARVSMSRRCPRRRRSVSATTGPMRTCPPRRRSSAPTRGGMGSRPRGSSAAFIWRARRSTRTPRSSSRRSPCRSRRNSRPVRMCAPIPLGF